jgi:hypothetical protein
MGLLSVKDPTMVYDFFYLNRPSRSSVSEEEEIINPCFFASLV